MPPRKKKSKKAAKSRNIAPKSFFLKEASDEVLSALSNPMRKMILKTLNYNRFSESVFKFGESLGCYNQLQVISDIQDYLNVCFNGYDMMPNTENGKDKNSGKKKDNLIMNG